MSKLKVHNRAKKCPTCKVPMKPEGFAWSDYQKEVMKKENECEHEFKNPEEICFQGSCVKCGYNTGMFHVEAAQLWRCPKCFNVYREEED